MKCLKELIKEIPEKFRLPEYQVFGDLRASYCFAISCFLTSNTNRLMWSHYANNHSGICLEFEIDNILENLHPCYYTDSFPEMNWKSNNINLSLIKEKAWEYEAEWRLVKTTTRPIMRMFGHIVHQVYNAVHQNKVFKVTDHYEWGDIQTSLMKKRETIYENERIIKIKPSAVFLGLLYRNNYTNELTGEKCKKILALKKENEVPLYKMVAQPNNFELSYIITDGSPNWLH